MMISNHVVQRLLLRSAGAVAASSTFSSYCGVSRSSRASIIVDFNGTIGSLSMMCIRSMASSSSFSPTTSDRQKRYDIKIVEVGPRDGLQNEKQFVSTQGKTELIENLANKANVGVIEAGAFVSPKWVPQMADSKEVFEHLNFGLDTTQKPYLSCLVPNIQGLEQVLQINNNKNSKSGHRIIDEIAIFGSASEEFSQRNIACSIDESFERFQTVADYLKDHQESSSANKLKIRGYVSTVVGCPYQGHVSPTKVASCVEKMLDLGCYEVSLGDTIGIGTPGSIQTMLEEVLVRIYLARSHRFVMFKGAASHVCLNSRFVGNTIYVLLCTSDGS